MQNINMRMTNILVELIVMTDYKIFPSKLTRSRKIQLRNFESEQISVEYTIELQDASKGDEALEEAMKRANEFLDNEERKLRNIKATYTLQITDEGKKFDFLIKESKDPQYANFIHLWIKKEDKDFYVGYLHRLTGEFKFKEENLEEINTLGIWQDKHFKIVEE